MNWYKNAIKERIPGGKAEGKDPSKYLSDQMDMGEKVEKEHTPDPAVAKEISRDHLEEFDNYYTGLDEMEKKLKKEKKKAGRGLYNQPQRDSYNQNAGKEIIKDWEVANRDELKLMKELAQQKRFKDMDEYGEKLIQQGFNRLLVEKIMTAAMYKVKL